MPTPSETLSEATANCRQHRFVLRYQTRKRRHICAFDLCCQNVYSVPIIFRPACWCWTHFSIHFSSSGQKIFLCIDKSWAAIHYPEYTASIACPCPNSSSKVVLQGCPIVIFSIQVEFSVYLCSSFEKKTNNEIRGLFVD